MVKPHRISSDANLNPELQAELGVLRGGMVAMAETVAVPDRFTFEPHPDRPAMTITDNETGKATTVALCNYRGVREVLSALFS